MKKPHLKPRKDSKDSKQDEPLMKFDEFVKRIVRVSPKELKPKKA